MSNAPDQENLLHGFFARSGRNQRSTFGAQLERAAIAHYDSAGRGKGPAKSWNWLPPSYSDPRPDQPIFVSGKSYGSGGYEIDTDITLTGAAVSRRIDGLRRTAPMSYAVIAEYYGEVGARWAACAIDRYDGDKEKDPSAAKVYTGHRLSGGAVADPVAGRG